MKKITLSAIVLGTMLAPLLQATPAHAQASRTWVSGVGDDVNPCSRTAPCKTYAGAISKTAAGGEINCLDPGGFGALTITKSISVVCDYTEGGVLASFAHGFTVNAPAGSIIHLKGQDVECFANGINGIRMLGVGVTLHVHKTQIRNCRGGGSGIAITPSSGVAKVNVSDTLIENNGSGVTGAGIQIRPTGGSASVVLNRVQVNNNVFGIAADGNGGTSGINVQIRDSNVNGNTQTGIIATTGAVGTGIMVDNSSVNHNTTGIAAAGAGAIVRVGRSSITGNSTGISGTAVQSYLNNQLNGNAGGEAFGGPVPGGLK